jgi:hypothetical protein
MLGSSSNFAVVVITADATAWMRGATNVLGRFISSISEEL